MNKEQMNEYLESIGGLENGFYPDRPRIVDSNFFSVDTGWYTTLCDEHYTEKKNK